MTYSASLQTRLRGGGISPPKIPAKKPWYQYFLEGMTEVGEAVATPFQAVGAAVSSPFLTRGGPTTGKLLEGEIARKVQEVRARGGDPTTDPELVELRRKAAAETRQTLLPGGAIQTRYQERVPMGAQLAIETVATAPLLMATSPLSGFRALAPAAKLGSPAARAGQVLLAAPAAVEFGLEQAIKLPFRGIRYAFIGMRKPFMKVAEAGGKGLERKIAQVTAEEAAEQASRESVFMLKGALNQAVETMEPLHPRVVEELSARFPGMKALKDVLAYPKANGPELRRLQTQAARMLKQVIKEEPKPIVETGKPYKAVVYRGLAKQPGITTEAYGQAPYGYWADREWVAQAYASGNPDTALKGRALQKALSDSGGRVVEREAYIHNPYVIAEEGDEVLRRVANKAAEKAAMSGADPVEQNRVAGTAIRKFLEKKGHDGLIVKTSEGYHEVIPYGAAVDTSMARREIVQMVTENEGPLAGRVTDRLLRRGIYTVDAHGAPGKNFQVQIGGAKESIIKQFQKLAKASGKRFSITSEPIREGFSRQYRLHFNIEGLPTSDAAQMIDDIFKQISRQGKSIELLEEKTLAPGVGQLGDSVEGIYLQAEQRIRTRAAAELIKLVKAAKPRKTWEEVKEARRIVRGRKSAEAAEVLAKGEGRARFLEARRTIKGRLPGPAELELPANLHENDKMVAALYNTIAETEKIPSRLTYMRLNTQEALDTLLIDRRLPNRSGIMLLGKVFGDELAESLLDLRPLSEKLMELFLDTINIPKALLASWDLSAPLRQGAILTIAHPTKAWPAFKKMVEAFSKEENAIYIHEAITRSKWASVREEAKLFIAPITHFRSGTGLSGLEESFMSKAAQKIWFVRRSERAYITYLNKLRADVFDMIAEGWTRNGEKIPMQQYKDLARFLNWATGRGPLGPMEKYGTLFNALVFSPRLQTSRMLLPWTMVSGSPAVRKLAAKDLAIFTGTVSSVLGILALHPDVNVELDPRSTDFGKLRIGDTRIDFFAGFQPYARLAVQMATGQRKSVSGRTVQVNRGQLIGQFLKTKRSPIVGIVQDALAGRDFLGEEMKYDVGGIFANLKDNFMPLFLQDLWDSVGTHGLVPGTFVAAPAFFGAGLQTYDASNQLVTEVFGEASRLERLLDEGQELIQKRDMENLQKYMRKNLTEGARIEQGQLALNKLTQLRRITRQLDALQNQKEDVEENPNLNNEIKEALMKQIDAQLIAIARDTLMWLGGLPTEASFQKQAPQSQGLSQESINKLRRGY